MIVNPQLVRSPIWRGWLLLTVALWMTIAPAVFATGLPRFFAEPASAGGEESSASPELHIYLYANSNPVMGFDLSGNNTIVGLAMISFSIATLTGIAVPDIPEVHKQRRAYAFRMTHKTNHKDVPNTDSYMHYIKMLGYDLVYEKVIEVLDQLQAAIAMNEDVMVKLLSQARRDEALVLILSHGVVNTGQKLGWGEYRSEEEWMARWNRGMSGDYLTADTCRFYACDEIHGTRKPAEIVEESIKPDLKWYFRKR